MAAQKAIANPIQFTSPPPQEESAQSAEACRELRIAALAYRKSEARGFEAGHELDDWLAAEREVDQPECAS